MDQIQEAGVPATPFEVSGSVLKAQIITVLGQAVAAVGAIITFLGVGEKTWINQTYVFLKSNDAVPVIGILAWGIAGIVLLVRSKRLKIQRIVMAFLLDDKKATVTGTIAPAALLAIAEAQKPDPSFRGVPAGHYYDGYATDFALLGSTSSASYKLQNDALNNPKSTEGEVR